MNVEEELDHKIQIIEDLKKELADNQTTINDLNEQAAADQKDYEQIVEKLKDTQIKGQESESGVTYIKDLCKQQAETIRTLQIQIDSDPPVFADHGVYWPGCRITDQGIFYIFMTVTVICITLIALIVIFSLLTLPILIN